MLLFVLHPSLMHVYLVSRLSKLSPSLPKYSFVDMNLCYNETTFLFLFAIAATGVVSSGSTFIIHGSDYILLLVL